LTEPIEICILQSQQRPNTNLNLKI